MGAGCYLCELNMAVFPSTQAGDAVGACKLCGVLACSGHAQRNRNLPAYHCGICKPNVLAAAAVRQAPAAPPAIPPPPPPPPTGGTRVAGTPTDAGYAQWAATIDDVTDVIDDFDSERWQALHADVDYLEGYLDSTDMPRELRVFGHSRKARRLMATAAALATQLNMPVSEMTPVLALVAEAVRIGSRR